jgi:hypothetical protein
MSGAWGPQGFCLDIGVRWLFDGTVAALESAKRADARMRQSLASEILVSVFLSAVLLTSCDIDPATDRANSR